jgi:hypothetical protein
MVKIVMELQTKSLEVTTSVLEKIGKLVEKAKKYIPTIHMNTNKEQTKEEVVVIGAKQP